ncbi:M48 family peptidase [bacterium]|nr:M48 family peptidase [bacterium]
MMNYKTKNNLEWSIEIIRKNNKNVYFRFKDDLILYVTCPIFLSKESVRQLLEENEEKLIKMYDKMLEKNKDNDLFLYLGKKYYIKVDESKEKVEFEDNFVYTKNLEMLKEFYEKQVKVVLESEMNIAKKCFKNLPEFSLKFRNMKTRWGVCNRGKMTVTLNTELLKKDIELIDYVIIHELCHFFEGNHSKNFWNLVGQAYPNYKEARRKLRE